VKAFTRTSLQALAVTLDEYPAAGIIGARQVGKTTLAKEYLATVNQDSIYLDLERPTDLVRLQDAETYLTQNADKCIILDEIQHVPELFPVLRSLIDDDRRPGRFIVLGSASPELLRQSSDALTGRIKYIELTPVTASELPPDEDVYKLWLRGGFPLSYLAKSDHSSLDWRNTFISSYADRELPQLGFPAGPALTRRILGMIAAGHGHVWNAEAISKGLEVSRATVNTYRDFLQSALLLRIVPPYSSNQSKRVVKRPKVYVRDSGALHALLRIENLDMLLGHMVAGFSWEGFVLEQVIPFLEIPFEASFIRTHHGAEADLVITKAGKPFAAAEIKLTNAPDVPKGFLNIIADLKTKNNFIITPTSDSFPIRKNIQVVSARTFSEWVKGL